MYISIRMIDRIRYMYIYIYIYIYDDIHMCSRNWKLLEGINSENLLSESDLGLRLELLNGIFYTVSRRVQKLPGF